MDVSGFVFWCILVYQWPGLESFTLREDGGSEQIASCRCRFVEIWLSTARDTSEIASYQVVPARESFSSSNVRRENLLRITAGKGCTLLFNNNNNNNKTWAKFHPRKHTEILVTKNVNCLAFWTKCNEQLLCVGIDLATTKGISQSVHRKLLMVTDGEDRILVHDYHYGVMLSGFVFCALVILVALCGLSSKKETSVYDGENGDIEIISSDGIVETIPQSSSVTDADVKTNNQTNTGNDTNIKPNDGNSNRLPSVNQCDVTHDQGETDGQVFTKKDKASQKKQEKNKKKAKKNENTYLPRSGTEGENVKQVKKGRFSLKSKSLPSLEKQKRAQCHSQEDLTVESLSVDQSNNQGDRRSFVARQLPQLPPSKAAQEASSTVEDSYAEPFDTKPKQQTVTPTDVEEEDDNYETVINHARENRIVSAKDEVRRSTMSSSTKSSPVGPVPDHDQDVFSDAMSDTYDKITNTTRKTGPGSSNDPLYEDVNSSGLYETPDISPRPVRAASDTTSGTPSLQGSKRKTKSLPHGKVQGPAPPPLENLRNMVRQFSHEGDSREEGSKQPEDIDPYTCAVKKGDYIIQETSLPQLPSAKGDTSPHSSLTPAQFEELYSKVDKEKQKRDRLQKKEKEELEKKAKEELEEKAKEELEEKAKEELEGETKEELEGETNEELEGEKTQEHEMKDNKENIIQMTKTKRGTLV